MKEAIPCPRTIKKRLSTGETYGYTQLCKILGLTPKSSHCKEAQLKQLSRYIELEKDGRKYKLVKIYSKPKEIKSRRQTPKDLVESTHHTKYVYSLLTRDLRKGPKDYNIHQLRCLLQFEKAEAKKLDGSIKEYYKKVYDVIFRSLNFLQEKGLIAYSKVYYVKTATSQSRKATPLEEEIISSCLKTVLLEYGCDSLEEVFKKGKYAKFYKSFLSLLKKTTSWKETYINYHIELKKVLTPLYADDKERLREKAQQLCEKSGVPFTEIELILGPQS